MWLQNLLVDRVEPGMLQGRFVKRHEDGFSAGSPCDQFDNDSPLSRLSCDNDSSSSCLSFFPIDFIM